MLVNLELDRKSVQKTINMYYSRMREFVNYTEPVKSDLCKFGRSEIIRLKSLLNANSLSSIFTKLNNGMYSFKSGTILTTDIIDITQYRKIRYVTNDYFYGFGYTDNLDIFYKDYCYRLQPEDRNFVIIITEVSSDKDISNLHFIGSSNPNPSKLYMFEVFELEE